jgi:hypothetical protein
MPKVDIMNMLTLDTYISTKGYPYLTRMYIHNNMYFHLLE